MTIDDIIIELYHTNFVTKFTAQQLTNRDIIDVADAVQHCWLEIIQWLRKNEQKSIEIYKKKGVNGIRQVASGIITRQCKSQSSSLYYQYVKKDANNLLIKRQNDKKQCWNESTGWNDEETRDD